MPNMSDAEHMRLLNLFSRAGLSMDHHQFNEEILDKGATAIKTRDGKLRAAVPSPLGGCAFINDIENEEMHDILRRHKQITKEFPRNGEGLEAYVDASDTVYTENNISETKAVEGATSIAGNLNVYVNSSKGVMNGLDGHPNGHVNGSASHVNSGTNGVSKLMEQADSTEAEHDLTNGANSFTNGSKA